MEYIIGIIVALVGGVFYFKNKSEKVGIENKISETKGRDLELEVQEREIKALIQEIDKNIEESKKKHITDSADRKNMTLKERADAAKNRYNN